MKSNIVLIGMMGTYKSSVGKLLAKELDMLFVDTDELIEFEYGRSIAEIFERFGEDFFRELEIGIIKRVAGFDNVVISTGGGVPVFRVNMERLSENGVVVLLQASVDAIYSRIGGGDKRPLARSRESVERLLLEREDCYKAFCDLVVDNSLLSSAETAERVLDGLREMMRGTMRE